MAKVSKDDFMSSLTAFIGDNRTDEAIKLLEDAADTIENETDVSAYVSEIEELKNKITETENTWREKYVSRFTDYTPQPANTENKNEVDTPEENKGDDDVIIPSVDEIADMF